MSLGANQFLPGTGRGAIRRMVEGVRLVCLTSYRRPIPYAPLHPDAARHGPPPRTGEELL